MSWLNPVSYTHLDVYKRQGLPRQKEINTAFAASIVQKRISFPDISAVCQTLQNLSLIHISKEDEIKADNAARQEWNRTADMACLLYTSFSSDLKNLLKREFNPDRPNAFWCTDITYIWTYDEGFVYLTSVMDLYSRKIISWVLTKDMKAESVVEAINIAKARRNIEKPLVIHSEDVYKRQVQLN